MAVSRAMQGRESAWVVKARAGRNDLPSMLRPGKRSRWVTRRPPESWLDGDSVFIWTAAPALAICGISADGRFISIASSTVFDLQKRTELKAPNGAARARFISPDQKWWVMTESVDGTWRAVVRIPRMPITDSAVKPIRHSTRSRSPAPA